MKQKVYYQDGTYFEGSWHEAPHLIDPFKVLHREDGPAVEGIDIEQQYWYLNGILHREGGPAIEQHNQTKFWYWNGLLHREDGPAIEWVYGENNWYLNGEMYFKEQFENCLREIDSLGPIIALTDPRVWVRNRIKRRLESS